MSVKSVLSIAFAVLCFAPLSANAQIFGHRASGCGCDTCGTTCCESAPSCGCEVSCDPCCAKPSLLAKLKAKRAARKACCAPTCCEPAPCCTPAPAPCCTPAPAPCCTPAPTCGCEVACCDPCAKPKTGFLASLKAKRAARKACCCEVAPSCGCEAAPAPSCGCH